ncbi:MAG: NTP transferase domain-containing protein [Defluviitaleaceae bacterium]|nr:NTP transferase domain-containing protein [Defluviitaleaceae bacterium]
MKPEYFVEIARTLADKPGVKKNDLIEEMKDQKTPALDALNECLATGLLEEEISGELVLSEKGQAYLDKFKVKNAVILAAEVGSRYIQMAVETPKGLLEMYGKPIIERHIEQLIEKGITDIVIVTGYKKEKFEYLKARYGVRLVYNPAYAVKNSLASLYRVMPYLNSTYVLLPDTWIEENIFNTHEARSWHSCLYFDGSTDDWCVSASKDDRIKSIETGGRDTRVMMGPAYFSPAFSAKFKRLVVDYYYRSGTETYYWEHVLKENLDTLPIYMNKQSGNVYGFESLKELSLFELSGKLDDKIKDIVSVACNVPRDKVEDITPIKEGMTNNSFIFSYEGRKYIVRTPGEGTDMLIDRKKEYDVYQAINPLIISDDIVYIDPETGIKITKYFDNARNCNPSNFSGVALCMKKLREFHEANVEAAHTFDIFERLEFYESLWGGADSYYYNYKETKANIMGMKGYIDSVPKVWTLCHIDSVPDNFLFIRNEGKREIRLIDWEYAGMQDGHIDIAMFAIYSGYNRKQIDKLIDSYFVEGCPAAIRVKMYAYVAVCGLLWSNWCEYKRRMGVEFGEYTLRQYRYARDFYKIFNAEYEKIKGDVK